MITIFNRKELAVTYSLAEKSRIEDILAFNGIPYYTKASGRMGGLGGSRARTGSMGQNMQLEYEYRIFVQKNQLELAEACLRKGGNRK